MDIDLRSLRCFTVLAETRSFSRSAERVSLAQPTFSQRIARLEDLLGFALFERRPGDTVLTPAGAEFLPHAEALLRQAEDLGQTAQRIAAGDDGVLRVGYTPVSFYSFVPRLIRAFEAAHPGVRLRLSEHLSDGIEVEIRAGRLDFGVLHPPLQRGARPMLALPGETFVAVLPEGHPLAQRDVIDPAELAGESLIFTGRSIGPAIFDRLVHMLRTANVEPMIDHEVSNSIAVIGLASAGRGIGFVIRSMAFAGRPGVCFRPLAGENVPELPFALSWQDRMHHPAAEKFRSFVAAWCGKNAASGTGGGTGGS
ncbi:LysR family transcriptional regulator [Frigidibacter oleivorans]|uniref:LysR family transcriptional regulator n=1 Tax=Frigidibacter oleivorans TaxID=2487129 RepID=UPI0013DFF189|nr:LysR family transcriptional regulator [Frigidibacter oleivorans]